MRRIHLCCLLLSAVTLPGAVETIKPSEAFALVATDPGLTRHPEIAEEVRALLGEQVEWLFIS